jgi:hypothetical protein
VRTPSECANDADVIFALDDSGTIDEPFFNDMTDFVAQLILDLDIDNGTIRVGLLTYSEFAEPRFNLNHFKTRLVLQV